MIDEQQGITQCLFLGKRLAFNFIDRLFCELIDYNPSEFKRNNDDCRLTGIDFYIKRSKKSINSKVLLYKTTKPIWA